MSAKKRIKYNQDNYVIFEDKVHKVLECLKSGYTLLEISTNSEIEVMWFEVEPIKLTEDILLKCGFVRHPWGLVLNNLLFTDDLKCSYLDFQVGNGFKLKINYLHEIQNLYFALKQELQIKFN